MGVNYAKYFIFIYLEDHMVFSFILLIWWITLINFSVKPTMLPCDKPHLVIVNHIFFIYYWIIHDKILLGNFGMFMKDTGLFHFLIRFMSDFGIGVILAFYNELGSFSSSILWKNLCKNGSLSFFFLYIIGINIFLFEVLTEFTCKTI